MSNHHNHHHHHNQGQLVDYEPLCAAVMELIPAYSVGATSSDETQLVETLLPFCKQAREELAQFQRMTDSMLHLVPDQGSPPPVSALIARLQDIEQSGETVEAVSGPTVASTIPLPFDVNQSQSAAPVTPVTVPYVVPRPEKTDTARTPKRASGSRNGLLIALAAASILLLAGVTTYWINQMATLQRDQQDLIALIAADQVETSAPPEAITISGTDHYRELSPAETIAEGASARFVWNVEQQVGAVFATNLPELPQDHVYQVWVVTLDGDSLSLGTFSVDEVGEGALVFKAEQPIESFTHIGISVEPGDGSSVPTTPHLVVGTI